jgi:hypothetical protein
MPLPGQVFINGVSNYIFGSHIGTDYAANTIRNTPAIQAKAKEAGITLLRCSIPQGSTDAYIDQTASACAACGADMLVILTKNGDKPWNQHLVSYLGNRCKLYEFGNEPDLGGVSWQTYLSRWNQEIPGLRQINPNAAFIGPALGVFGNRESYLKPWLQGCLSSGVLPDGISFHIYPCTGQGSSSVCSTKSGNFKNDAATMNALVTGVLGHTLPLCLTEWNIDANNPPQSYTQDSAYVDAWYQQAIDAMVQGGYAICNQFSFASYSANGKLDLVNTQSPYNIRAGYTTLKTKITQYLGTAVGGGGGDPGQVTNPMTFTFSNAAATTVATSNALYTKTGGAVNTWKYSRVGTAVNWGEVTSQGTTSAWAASGSIGSQTGKGFLFDSTFMEGKQISAGAISANVRLNCSRNGDDNDQAGTITADIVCRLSKRASGGTYTTILTMTKSAQTIPSGFTTFALSGTLGSAATFATGDKLYIDVWVKVLTNSNGWSDLDLRLNRLSTDTTGLAGDINASLTVPSVQSVTTATTTALSLYTAAAVSDVLGTASKFYIAASGSPTTTQHYSRIGTATGWGEVCSQTTTAAWAAAGSIGSPTGKGFFLDGSLLSNKQIVAGNWVFKTRFTMARAQDTLVQTASLGADIIMRAYKYKSDGGTYTLIKSSTLTGQTLSTTFTTFTLPTVAADSITFNPGEYLYVDIWLNATTNSGTSDQDVRINRLSTDTVGLLGDPETVITTPGYADLVLGGGGGEGGITITAAQITLEALKLFRNQLTNTVKFVAFGDNSTALSPNDTRLYHEFFRKAVSSTQQGANPGEVLINVYLAPGDAVDKDIREIGFFGGDTATSNANSGTLIARALYSTDDKTNSQSFVFQLDLSYLLG